MPLSKQVWLVFSSWFRYSRGPYDTWWALYNDRWRKRSRPCRNSPCRPCATTHRWQFSPFPFFKKSYIVTRSISSSFLIYFPRVTCIVIQSHKRLTHISWYINYSHQSLQNSPVINCVFHLCDLRAKERESLHRADWGILSSWNASKRIVRRFHRAPVSGQFLDQ